MTSKIIFNLSPKKTGTTFISNLIAANGELLPNIVVPCITKFGAFPRVGRNSNQLFPPSILDLSRIAIQERNNQTNEKQRLFCSLLAENPLLLGNLTPKRVAKRLAKILSPFADQSIYIGDPNNITDLANYALGFGKTNLHELILEINRLGFETVFFSLYREHYKTAASLLKMQLFDPTQVNVSNKSTIATIRNSISTLKDTDSLKNIFTSCILESDLPILINILRRKESNTLPIYIWSFDQMCTSPRKFLVSLAEKLRITTDLNIKDFNDVPNPNPSVENNNQWLEVEGLLLEQYKSIMFQHFGPDIDQHPSNQFKKYFKNNDLANPLIISI